MKALFYHSPKDVQIDDKPLSNIINSEDVKSRVTSTVIYGSDLHLYHDTIHHGMQPGQTLRHEFMGIRVEVEEGEAKTEVHEVEKWGN